MPGDILRRSPRCGFYGRSRITYNRGPRDGMKLLIAGATGATGLELMEQALEAGHTVTAFARRPASVRLKHPNLKVHQGDILDYAAVKAAVRGQDAVLSALGVRQLGRNTILSDGTR